MITEKGRGYSRRKISQIASTRLDQVSAETGLPSLLSVLAGPGVRREICTQAARRDDIVGITAAMRPVGLDPDARGLPGCVSTSASPRQEPIASRQLVWPTGCASVVALCDVLEPWFRPAPHGCCSPSCGSDARVGSHLGVTRVRTARRIMAM